MPCRSGGRVNPLDETGKAVLGALSSFNEPAGCKEIAERAGLDVRKVMAKLRSLLKEGYVERPVEGKYLITDKGRAALAG